MLTLTVLGLAVRSFGLLLLSTVLALLMRRTTASMRRVVWLLGILSVLALPFVWRVTPELPVAADQIPGFVSTVQQPIFTGAIDHLAELSEAPAPIPPNGASIIETPPKPMNPVVVFAIVWGLVGTILLLKMTYSLISASRVIRQGKPFETIELPELLTDLGIRRDVRLIVTERLAVPATSGLFRPVVLFPKNVDEWSRDRLRMVLAHELAHVRQNDWIFSIAAQLACAMVPFNPLIWFGAYRLRVESEHAADDRAILVGFQPKAYAEGLLDIAKNARLVTVHVVSMARSPHVEARLRAIVDGKRRRGSAALTAVAFVGLAAVGSCGLFAGFRLADPQGGSSQAAVAIPIQDEPPGSVWKGPIKVRVVDERGLPCAGAKLSFYMETPGVSTTATAEPEPVTDSNGEYLVKPEQVRSAEQFGTWYFKSSSLVEVRAYLPGHALSSSSPIKKGAADVTVHLSRSNTARIPVFDPSGRPAAGVALVATRLSIGAFPAMNIPKSWRAEAFRAVSDANGFAEFHDIPEGWSVTFDTDDDRYLSTPRRQQNPAVLGTTIYPPLHLTLASALEGTATLNGKPLSGLRVQANWSGPLQARSATTDSNGRYRITKVPAGVCDVHYVAFGEGDEGIPKGYVARQHNNVQAPVGQIVSGLDFRFETGGFIAGSVVDKNGIPRQFEIEALPPDFVEFRNGPARNPGDYHNMSDGKAGTYFMRVPPGHYRVIIGAGTDEQQTEVDVKDGQTVVANFKVPY